MKRNERKNSSRTSRTSHYYFLCIIILNAGTESNFIPTNADWTNIANHLCHLWVCFVHMAWINEPARSKFEFIALVLNIIIVVCSLSRQLHITIRQGTQDCLVTVILKLQYKFYDWRQFNLSDGMFVVLSGSDLFL